MVASPQSHDDSSEGGTTVTLTVTVPIDQLPQVGERVEARLSNGMVAVIENRGAGKRDESVRVPRSLNYATVATTDPASEVVHAAIVRRVNNRIRYNRFTICDQKGKRIVARGLHEPLEGVTCKQCRKQLIEDGVLVAEAQDSE